MAQIFVTLDSTHRVGVYDFQRCKYIMIDLRLIAPVMPMFKRDISLDDGTHDVGRQSFFSGVGDGDALVHISRDWLEMRVQGSNVTIRMKRADRLCGFIVKAGARTLLTTEPVRVKLPFELRIPRLGSARRYGSKAACGHESVETITYRVSRHLFRCTQCRSRFTTNSALLNHVAEEHRPLQTDARGWANKRRH
jgi:hypothetical protein